MPKTDVAQMILWICEVPRTSHEILGQLHTEGSPVSYPTLMSVLGLLEAQRKLRKIKRMDNRVMYQTIREIPSEVPKTPNKPISEVRDDPRLNR